MSAPRFMVVSAVWRSGQKKIDVLPFSEKKRDNFISVLSQFERSGSLEDWQVASYEDLQSLRSGIMNQFGIGWFNMARKNLAGLGA